MLLCQLSLQLNLHYLWRSLSKFNFVLLHLIFALIFSPVYNGDFNFIDQFALFAYFREECVESYPSDILLFPLMRLCPFQTSFRLRNGLVPSEFLSLGLIQPIYIFILKVNRLFYCPKTLKSRFLPHQQSPPNLSASNLGHSA